MGKQGDWQREEAWQKRKKFSQEEEEEEREIQEYCLSLDFMREDCVTGGEDIRVLIEEQQEMLNILFMKKREIVSDFEKLKDYENI